MTALLLPRDIGPLTDTRQETLRSTNAPPIDQDFAGLHNISKHIIYLEESSDAILLTLKNLRDEHQSIKHGEDRKVQRTYRNTQRALTNTETGFQTASLRVKSLHKRMQNVIGLVSAIYIGASAIIRTSLTCNNAVIPHRHPGRKSDHAAG
jgi:hypothetical protein